MHLVISGFAGLANYNFTLNYHTGKVNVDVDALSYILKGEYDQSIEAESVCALIYQAIQGTTLIEAYSCNFQVTKTLDRMEYTRTMSEKDWIITQNRDPVIREIKYLMNKGGLTGWNVYSWDAPSIRPCLN